MDQKTFEQEMAKAVSRIDGMDADQNCKEYELGIQWFMRTIRMAVVAGIHNPDSGVLFDVVVMVDQLLEELKT